MKTMKLLSPLALALAVTLTLAGCTHKPGYLTKLPGPTANNNLTDPSTFDTKPFQPDTNPIPVVDPNGIKTASLNDFDNMAQDREALAAYTVHFAYDSAAVKKSEQANLQSVASELAKEAGTKLLIEGNCDERGTEEYNRSLGERRALALREGLAKLGVDPSRVRTISYGKDKPVDTGHDEAAFAKNRRGDFILLRPKSGV